MSQDSDRKKVKEVLERSRKRQAQLAGKKRKVKSPVTHFALILPVAILMVVASVAGMGWVGRDALITASSEWAATGDTEVGDMPTVSTILDAEGNTIAHVYDQYRRPVRYADISDHMKNAIVAIEDKRFYEHGGVDFQGTIRAALNNIKGNSTQGASTLEQQYAKNYRWLVKAQTDEEREAAVEQSLERKLKDIQSALKMDQELDKQDILTLYLNVVPFGHNTFGVEAASQVYFGVSAAELTPPQAAMLAGMVQSPEYNNPYTYPEHATERRNIVLGVMRDQGFLSPQEAQAHMDSPLGLLEVPNKPGTGCITAGENGFFCDYALEYLAAHGMDAQEVARGGYTITTTLDPVVQSNAVASLKANTSPQADRAQTMSTYIAPGDNRAVLSLASSRNWGLDVAAQETSLNSATLNSGDGAGSTFKIFTAGAYLEQGGSIGDKLPTPETSAVFGMGSSDTPGCPSGAWCIKNAGSYPGEMTLQDALAQSPNTTFAELIGQVGVEPTVDLAIRLGLRSYDAPRGGNPSWRDELVAANQGAFTLGFTPVNTLEMANVGASLASSGRWCEPNPIAEVRDRNGQKVPVHRSECEQVMDAGAANELSVGMSHDDVDGTAADAAKRAGWDGALSSKTGTTDIHRSSSFLGYTSTMAGFVYTISDGEFPVELCSYPLRACPGGGDLFGGKEPALTWFNTVGPIKDRFGPSKLAGT